MQRGFVLLPVILIVTVVIITAVLFYRIGQGSVETKVETLPHPSATIFINTNDTLKASPSYNALWETVAISKVSDFWNDYSISFPKSWQVNEKYSNEMGSEITLSKGENKL